MNYGLVTLKPRQMNELPAMLIGIVGCGFWAVLTGFPWGLVAIVAAIPFALLAFRTLFIRLHYGNDSISVTIGPWRRAVKLSGLKHIGYRRSGRTALLLLEDEHGDHVPLEVTRFQKPSEWARLLLDAISTNPGIIVDPHARKTLQMTGHAGEAWVD